ncbi:MAG: hypothetical protein ACE5RJ_01195 [Nitrosopumilaceae archaeon]
MDLNAKVFGNITLKEVIGETPSKIEIQDSLSQELEILLKGLNEKDENELKNLLEDQNEMKRQVDSRPGAMALAQDKIALFVEYCKKYTDAISSKLNN